MKTKGVSYKLVADLLTSATAFLIAYFGIELDPTVSAGLAKGIGFVAGYFTPPNAVADESGLSLVEALVVLLLVLVILFALGVLR